MAKSKHYSHIDFETRIRIESYVVEGRTLTYMSRELGVDATSISRELKRNRRSDGARASISFKTSAYIERHVPNDVCATRSAGKVQLVRKALPRRGLSWLWERNLSAHA